MEKIIDHITIKEMEVSEKRKVCLVVTIHLKLNDYAPKQTLEFLKNIRYTDEQKKTSKFQNETCLPLGGGEVKTLLNTPFFESLKLIQNTRFSLIAIPLVA